MHADRLLPPRIVADADFFPARKNPMRRGAGRRHGGARCSPLRRAFGREAGRVSRFHARTPTPWYGGCRARKRWLGAATDGRNKSGHDGECAGGDQRLPGSGPRGSGWQVPAHRMLGAWSRFSLWHTGTPPNGVRTFAPRPLRRGAAGWEASVAPAAARCDFRCFAQLPMNREDGGSARPSPASRGLRDLSRRRGRGDGLGGVPPGWGGPARRVRGHIRPSSHPPTPRPSYTPARARRSAWGRAP
jgi:hypothetical protein